MHNCSLMLNAEACGGTLWFGIPFMWFYGEYKSPFVDVCNTLGGPKGLICGLMSDGFALNLFIPCGLVSRVHLCPLWHLCGPKNITRNNWINTGQHDFGIKHENLSHYLHTRKPRMSRGPRWARVWTLHPMQSKKLKIKLNNPWCFSNQNIHGGGGPYQVRTAQHSSCTLNFRGNTSSLSFPHFVGHLRAYTWWQ